MFHRPGRAGIARAGFNAGMAAVRMLFGEVFAAVRSRRGQLQLGLAPPRSMPRRLGN